jgi:hypothetical protein
VYVDNDWELITSGSGFCRRGLIHAQMEVEFLVENTVFEEDGVVVDDRGVEVDVFEAENGAVAVELEEAHAVLYYLWERTHCCFSVLRFVAVGNRGNVRDISRGKGRWVWWGKCGKLGVIV